MNNGACTKSKRNSRWLKVKRDWKSEWSVCEVRLWLFWSILESLGKHPTGNWKWGSRPRRRRELDWDFSLSYILMYLVQGHELQKATFLVDKKKNLSIGTRWWQGSLCVLGCWEIFLKIPQDLKIIGPFSYGFRVPIYTATWDPEPQSPEITKVSWRSMILLRHLAEANSKLLEKALIKLYWRWICQIQTKNT